MRVLIVASEYPPILGGGSSYTKYLVQALLNNDIEVVLLVSGEKDSVEKKDGCTVYRNSNLRKLYLGKGDFFTGVKEVMEIIRKELPDVLHSHHSLPSLIVQAANLDFGLSHFITHHKTPEPCGGKLRIYDKWSVFNLVNSKHSGSFITSSRAFRDSLLEHGVDAEKIILIYPAVDYEKFRKFTDYTKVKILRRKLGLASRDKLVLIPAKLRKRKGIDFAIKGLSRLKKRGNSRIAILVSGLAEGKVPISKLKSLEKLVYPHKLLRCDYFKDEEMPLLYNSADVVLLPSLAEGLGMALLEAMACGCPVVGTNVIGIDEVIENDVNGRLVEFGNTGELVQAIEGILFDKNLRERYIKNGFETVNSKFGLLRQGQLHKRAYESSLLCKKQSAGGVLYKLGEDGLSVYLVKHKEYGYVLPKGGKEKGEAWVEAAVREVREETGYLVSRPKFLIDKISFKFEKEGLVYEKEVIFYAFEIDDKSKKEGMDLEEGEKLVSGEWFVVEKAVKSMAHESEAKTVLRLQELLVASKGNK